MSARGCAALAVAAALAGAALRLAVPVTPPDEALRAVIAFYASAGARTR